MNHIVIIGGGFTGSLTAINLARFAPGPLRITLVSRGHPPGRGIAYATPNGSHLLNVAARNMSALADQPDHFVEWLQTRSEYAGEPPSRLREKFVPRRTYGDYLASLLLWHSHAAAEKGIRLEICPQEAVDVVPAAAGASVVLGNGQSLAANRVILATGNQAPSPLRARGLEAGHPRYVPNPWVPWEAALGDPTENAILVGTGLTMIDVFLSLRDRGWKGKVLAVSRHGLLPMPHFKGTSYSALVGDEPGPVALSRLLALFRERRRHARAEGVNPAVLVDKLRPLTQRLWQNFTLREKRSFNAHLRTRWNVARHRIAQSIHQQLVEAMAAHRLEIVKGAVEAVEDSGDQLVATVRSGDSRRRLEGGVLINCTGPAESYSASNSALYRSLLLRGLVQADEMDLGIRVTEDFAAVDEKGRASALLFAVGPLLKGTLWESSAVPELRSQAFRLAKFLTPDQPGGSAGRIRETTQPVLEYQI